MLVSGRVACLSVVAAVAGVVGCGGDGRNAGASSKAQFIARADAVCARLPAGLDESANVPGTFAQQLVGGVHRYADAYRAGAGELRQLGRPAGRDGARARLFVDAMTRLAGAMAPYESAFEDFKPADPTDSAAVERSFAEISAAGAVITRLSVAADDVAAGYGFRRCGHLRPRRRPARPQGGPATTPTFTPQADLSRARRRQIARGRDIAVRSGCLACHRIQGAGHDGPGRDLSRIGARLSPAAITRVLHQPPAPMPAYRELPQRALRALVAFLSALRR